ncbi:glycerophosphodiester phosphodiesterase family protein [Hyphomonas sp.]|uniref:glycerophosphodiester phosphodiesterase family protein n=1 Tax=Hyphomonas sp. TaxID=87 RepID=UPI0032EE5DF4
MLRIALSIAALATLAACGDISQKANPDAADDPALSASAPALPLPDYFDCVRQNKGVLIAGHRGGPAPGYPENTLETLQYGFSQGIRVFEIDVAESRDGVLLLMHDNRLNRTTTGDGYVADTDWATLSGLRMIDNDGQRTDFQPPKLTDVLLWAKQSGAILELDRKPTTSFRNIASAVRAAGAGDNVLMISYSDAEAAEIAAADPALMLTASARGSRDIGRLEALGVDRTRLVAWTGTNSPDYAAWARNLKEGVEPAFGTLGRRGERLDDLYWADGDGSEYRELVDNGLVLLATDEPYRVAAALTSDDLARQTCGR